MKIILKIAQKHMGSAQLEAKTPMMLLKSIIGKILQNIASTNLPVGSKFRCALERLRGVNIGKDVFLSGGNTLDRVRPDLITIEDNVSIAGNVTILTHSKPTVPIRDIIGDALSVTAPVTIKNGAWVTVNCVILPGVTIGENSIISAGSVVHKDVPPYAIVSGNPAKVVKIYKKTEDKK